MQKQFIKFIHEYSVRIVCSIALLFLILFPIYGCVFSFFGLSLSIMLYFMDKKTGKRDMMFAVICFLLSTLIMILELIAAH